MPHSKPPTQAPTQKPQSKANTMANTKAAWQFFAPRFLPLGCLYTVALLPVERLADARRRVALGGLAAFTAASLVWAVQTSVALRARVGEALSGLEAPVTRTGPRLVVAMDPFAGLTADEALVPLLSRKTPVGAKVIPTWRLLRELGLFAPAERAP